MKNCRNCKHCGYANVPFCRYDGEELFACEIDEKCCENYVYYRNIKEDKAEFKGQIIDAFEDYCGDGEIIIDNLDRQEYIEDEGEDTAAAIFGDSYDYIGDEIEYLVNKYGLETKSVDRNTGLSIARSIVNKFRDLLGGDDVKVCGKPAKVTLSAHGVDMLVNKTMDTFRKWGVV